jgi:hypothetical protein
VNTRRRPRTRHCLALCIPCLTLACRESPIDNANRHWQIVAHNAQSEVAIDLLSLGFREDGSLGVTFKTTFTEAHQYKARSWSTQLAETRLWCGSMRYRVVLLDLFNAHDKLVSRQFTVGPRRPIDQRWDFMIPNSDEEEAARAACAVASSRRS